jgi:hypothetical protein
VGALVQEAMRKKWFGEKAFSARLSEERLVAAVNDTALAPVSAPD